MVGAQPVAVLCRRSGQRMSRKGEHRQLVHRFRRNPAGVRCTWAAPGLRSGLSGRATTGCARANRRREHECPLLQVRQHLRSTSMLPFTSVFAASTGFRATFSFMGTGDPWASSTMPLIERSMALSRISPICGVWMLMVSAENVTSPIAAFCSAGMVSMRCWSTELFASLA